MVAYFSHSGKIPKIARQIYKKIGGDVFKIQIVTGYPSSYKDLVAQAKQEIQSGAKPLLRKNINNIDEYKSIFAGYPNWWNTFPPPVLTFLTDYNFKGKTIVPFCTHGGWGIGNSLKLNNGVEMPTLDFDVYQKYEVVNC